MRRNVEEYKPSTEREEVGRVIEAGDGIARVKGLPRAMANELLEFPGGVLGSPSTSTRTRSAASSWASPSHIEEGDPVKQTGRILSVPVGDGFLGRVVDALGRPLDGKGAIQADEHAQPRGPGAHRRRSASR